MPQGYQQFLPDDDADNSWTTFMGMITPCCVVVTSCPLDCVWLIVLDSATAGFNYLQGLSQSMDGSVQLSGHN